MTLLCKKKKVLQFSWIYREIALLYFYTAFLTLNFHSYYSSKNQFFLQCNSGYISLSLTPFMSYLLRLTWSVSHFPLFSPPSPSFFAFLSHTLWSWKLTLNPELRGTGLFRGETKTERERELTESWVGGTAKSEDRREKKCWEGHRKLNSKRTSAVLFA